MKKGFTLAEIMIALVVIGVITSILLPVAFNNVPNENVMKFKKGNATLAKVINELVTSGEYYTPGDLGIKADGALLDGKEREDDITYFCESIASIINTKQTNCSNYKFPNWDFGLYVKKWGVNLDSECATYTQAGEELVLDNNIVFYQLNPSLTFGMQRFTGSDDLTPIEDCINAGGNEFECQSAREYTYEPEYRYFFAGLETEQNVPYKIFCIDIDGIGKGEDPFGYGIRVDGKIILGARAQEWIEKSIQEK